MTELFDGMCVFVSFRVVMPGTLAEVTPVVWFADAGAGVVSAGSVGGRI